MLTLELMTGEQPFSNIPRDINVLYDLAKGKLPERPGPSATLRGLSDELWMLMRQCWHKKPESRPSMTDIKLKIEQLIGNHETASSAQGQMINMLLT